MRFGAFRRVKVRLSSFGCVQVRLGTLRCVWVRVGAFRCVWVRLGHHGHDFQWQTTVAPRPRFHVCVVVQPGGVSNLLGCAAWWGVQPGGVCNLVGCATWWGVGATWWGVHTVCTQGVHTRRAHPRILSRIREFLVIFAPEPRDLIEKIAFCWKMVRKRVIFIEISRTSDFLYQISWLWSKKFCSRAKRFNRENRILI